MFGENRIITPLALTPPAPIIKYAPSENKTRDRQSVINKIIPCMKPHNPREKSNERRYSYEDMKLWVQKMIESKTSALLLEINENNSIIKVLSEKLSKAESQLNKKEQLLESACQKIFATNRTVSHSSGSPAGVIEIINKLLNDKLRDKFETVQGALEEIQSKEITQSRHIVNVTQYQKAMEQMMSQQIQSLKQELRSKMEDIKAGNEKYWGKIKGWAKLFEEKEKKCEEGILALHKEVKKCGEGLGEGVMEIYRLKSFKGRVKEMEKAVYDLEESFKLIGERQIEMKETMEMREYRPDTIELSYSKDQSQIYYLPENPKKSRRSHKEHFHTTADEYYQLRDLSKSPIRDQAQSRVISNSSSIFHNFAKKPLPQDMSMLSSVKSDNLRQSFCSRIKSIQNLSTNIAHSRKQMIHDITHRLLSQIETKKLSTPLPCHIDQFGYLKNQQDNYMFDCEGNMFKVSPKQFQELCYAQIISPLH